MYEAVMVNYHILDKRVAGYLDTGADRLVR